MGPDGDGGDRPLTARSSFALRGEELRTYIRQGVDTVRDLVASTYGPGGMDKLVTLEGRGGEMELVLTSAGHEVLDAIERGDGFTHPVAAIVVDAIDTVHRALNDGSTVTTLLTASLLERGFELVEAGLAPRQVVVGYALAAERTGRVLDELARPVTTEDGDRLRQVARTVIGHRVDEAERDRYAALVVEAVGGLSPDESGLLDTEHLKVVSAANADTTLHRGVVVTRWPRGIDRAERSQSEFDFAPSIATPLIDATVAVLDGEIDVEATATNFGEGGRAGIRLDDVEALTAYREGYHAAVEAVVDHVDDLGVDVLISQPRVDGDLVEALEDRGVEVVDKVETPEADIDRLARATGATVVSRPEDLTTERLGTAGRVVERRTASEKWTCFLECPGPVFTLELRSPTAQAAQLHERVVEAAADAVAIAAMDRQVVPGAGAAQLAVAAALREHATSVEGKEQLAVIAFAEALEETVETLARNAGVDPVDALTALRAAHAEAPGRATTGLDLATGEPVDAWDAGVVEPRRTLSQALETARTLAAKFLTTDSLLYPRVDLATYDPQTEHD